MSRCFMWSLALMEQSDLKQNQCSPVSFSLLSFSPFAPPFCVRSSLCTPSQTAFPLCPSVLCFVLSLSLSPSSPLHAVVCRHAGISGPQNDRPNLSALAAVTKDGCLSSVCACTCWSYFPCDWAPLICLRLTCCWQKCEFHCLVCVGTRFYV